jgi:endoglucanase
MRRQTGPLVPVSEMPVSRPVGGTATRRPPHLDASYKTQLRAAVKAYVAQMDEDLSATPFGVPPSMGTWGGSAPVVDLGIRMCFLHKAFPDIVGTDYTPGPPTTCLAGIRYRARPTCPPSGRPQSQKLRQYPRPQHLHSGWRDSGYILIKPDFPECIDDSGFLWFEDEYVISDSARWIVAANAADAIVR